MVEGVEGLLRDKTRPSRIAPLDDTVAERVIALTQADPPGEATHWMGLPRRAQARRRGGSFPCLGSLMRTCRPGYGTGVTG